jgi:hypothetical protein
VKTLISETSLRLGEIVVIGGTRAIERSRQYHPATRIVRPSAELVSTERMHAAAKCLEQTGIEPKRFMHGFALGNYHQLVPSDTEAGRAFNRRIELRPTH